MRYTRLVIVQASSGAASRDRYTDRHTLEHGRTADRYTGGIRALRWRRHSWRRRGSVRGVPAQRLLEDAGYRNRHFELQASPLTDLSDPFVDGYRARKRCDANATSPNKFRPRLVSFAARLYMYGHRRLASVPSASPAGRSTDRYREDIPCPIRRSRSLSRPRSTACHPHIQKRSRTICSRWSSGMPPFFTTTRRFASSTGLLASPALPPSIGPSVPG